MSIYIDADVFVAWEKGEFHLIAWLEKHSNEPVGFPPTVWQQLVFGTFAWEPARALRRQRHLKEFGARVSTFSRKHAQRAARIAADLKSSPIGFADCQIAACALEDHAELLTFNIEHFNRVPGLGLASV